MVLKKTEDSNFCKDDSNGTVINTNVNSFLLYKKQRDSQNQMLTLQKKVESLEKDVSEMKNLINKMVKNYGNSNF